MGNFAKEYFHITSSSNYIKNADSSTPNNNNAALERFVEQVSPLKKLIDKPKSIVSIGVGEGIEIEAYSRLYPDNKPKFAGIDVSPDVLETTKQYFDSRGIEADLIEADAAHLPFADNSIDVISMIAILHEVFSYAVDGKVQYDNAIAEAARKLSENGVLFIRDFPALDTDQDATLTPKTQFALDFYNYFRETYRSFSGYDNGLNEEGLTDIVANPQDYPLLKSVGEHITLPANIAAEMLLHFKNFDVHFAAGSTFIGDKKWKEINECYLVPNPLKPGHHPMSAKQATSTIQHIADKALAATPYAFELVYNEFSPRPWVKQIIEQHFTVTTANNRDSQAGLLDEIVQFMDLGFRKVRKSS